MNQQPNLDRNALLSQGADRLEAGELSAAEEIFRKVLTAFPRDVDALHLLGVTRHQAGFNDEAIEYVGKAVKGRRPNPVYLNNLGLFHKAAGNAGEASKCFRKAVKIDPSYVEAHLNLGVSLFELGKADEAIKRFRLALKHNPEYPQAHYNLGTALFLRNDVNDAISCFRRTIELVPNYMDAHVNLALALNRRGDTDEAIAGLKRVIQTDPNHVKPHLNLSRLLFGGGNLGDALEHARKAIHLSPDDIEARDNFHEILSEVEFLEYDEALKQELTESFLDDTAGFSDTKGVGFSLIKLMPEIHELANLVDGGKADEFSSKIRNGTAAKALGDPLFIKLLSMSVACDPSIERLLTAARKTLLILSEANDGQLPEKPEYLEFVCALSLQCHLNEYVYATTEEEIAKLESYVNTLMENTGQDSGGLLFAIAVGSCYAPLGSLGLPEEILTSLEQNAGPLFARIVERQLKAPEDEKNISAGIRTFGTSDDEVSERVRRQYEENPYPRWSGSLGAKQIQFPDFLKDSFPHLPDGAGVGNGPLDILIAGCGTGRQAIHSALKYADSQLLALDLSKASLAYAIRKARQLGVGNIDFMQADILSLNELERSFDIVECVGVLHHMDDPLAGWSILVDRLKGGGFMRIGLYSESAHRYVTSARDFALEHGYEASVEGIRAFRQALLALPDKDPVKKVTLARDFYTTSECRDLVFHVQERQYTIPQITENLETLGLEFVGFEFTTPTTKRRYTNRFPDDPAATSLPGWHLFEQENPDTFQGMYQFWLRKLSS